MHQSRSHSIAQDGIWVSFKSSVFRVSLTRKPVHGQPVLLLADKEHPSEICSYQSSIPDYRVFGCIVAEAHSFQ